MERHRNILHLTSLTMMHQYINLNLNSQNKTLAKVNKATELKYILIDVKNVGL